MKVIQRIINFFGNDEVKKLSRVIAKETYDAIKKAKEFKKDGWTKEEKKQMKKEILDVVNPTIDLMIERSDDKKK